MFISAPIPILFDDPWLDLLPEAIGVALDIDGGGEGLRLPAAAEYEKVSVIVTSNKSFETWAEMMGDSVMTTALLDRLLHHARVFTLDGESYRIKKSRKEV